MRISDLSSDVCSSVLIGIVQLPLQPTGGGGAATARGLDALLHPIDRHQKMCPSRTIIARNMPSRMPRSATFSSLAGQASNIASNMAQPATTRSARSSPMHALAARSLTDWEDRRSLMRSEEHTSELQSLMRHSYAVFGL